MQTAVAETALKALAEALPESVQDLEGAKEAITEEGRLLGFSEEEAMVIFDELLEEERRVAAEDTEDDEEEANEARTKLLESIKGENSEKEEEGPGAFGPEDDQSASAKGVGKGGIIAECESCKFTLFVAKGREEKFFGDGFKCPECGAPRDSFNVKNQ